jgi:hypothetical protein
MCSHPWKRSFHKQGILRSLVDKFAASSETPQIDAHFISESGLVDVFVFLGPTPVDISRQYTQLTGVMPLPPVSADDLWRNNAHVFSCSRSPIISAVGTTMMKTM